MTVANQRWRLVLALAAGLISTALAVADRAMAIPPRDGVTPSTAVEVLPAIAGDTVRVHQAREFTASAQRAVAAAASAIGARVAIVHVGTVGLERVRRGTELLLRLSGGFRYPVSLASLELSDARALYGTPVADALANGMVVISSRSAARRGLRVGDKVSLYGWNRHTRRFSIGFVSDSIETEFLLSSERARQLGVKRPAYAVLWGFASRDSVLEALEERKTALGRHRVMGSWMARHADSTLTTDELKDEFGEFAVTNGEPMRMDPVWRSANIRMARWRIGRTVLVKPCNRKIAAETAAIFEEITAWRLDRFIDIGATASRGGCQQTRRTRSLGGSVGGQISSHAWGVAIDLSPAKNCVGCEPTIPCAIVQIFRAHGFAWGGNFLIPDGMHFEWVGERRDTLPSRPDDYCPTNLPTSP